MEEARGAKCSHGAYHERQKSRSNLLTLRVKDSVFWNHLEAKDLAPGRLED
jgi:hypothetical protein